MYFHVDCHQVCRRASLYHYARDQHAGCPEKVTEQAFTRRQLLQRGGLIAAAPLLHACDTAVTALCADPEFLSRGEEQMRKTHQYSERSTTAAQACSSCQFFSSDVGEGQECGHCDILDGGVNQQAHCTAWALRS